MNTIEITFRRKSVGLFFAACVLILLLSAYVSFFTDKYRDSIIDKVSLVAGVVFFSYKMYAPFKKLLKKQPIIVLADDSIVLNEKKTVAIPKRAIREIEVVHDEEDGYFLHIKTEKERHKIQLTWLHTTPDEMKNLIERYKP
jgi:hypothetical protein